MVPVLLLGHAGLAVVAVGAGFLGVRWRRRTLVPLCLIGLALGVTLAVAAGSDEVWRTNRLGPGTVLPALGVSAAWLVAAAAPAARGRWMTVATTAVAASCLAMAGTTEWVAPALVFFGGLALATAALAETDRAPQVAIAVFVATVAAAVALGSRALEGEAWSLAGGIDGWARYVLIGAAVVQAGALPALGVWDLVNRGGAAALPLVVAGAFVFMDLALDEPDRWAALALVVLALAVTAWALLRTVTSVSFSVAALILFLLATVAASPAALPAAAAAAIAVVGGAVLWPLAGDDASPERSLVLAPIAAMPAVAALAIAGVTAVESSTLAEGEIEKVPWTLVVVLLGVVAAAMAGVAARTGSAGRGAPIDSGRSWFASLRRGESHAWSLLALRALVVASIAFTYAPSGFLGGTVSFLGGEPRQLALLGAAVIVGGATAWLSGRRGVEVKRVESPLVYDIPQPFPLLARVLTWTALVLGVATVAAVGWVVTEGLRVGFL